MRHSKFFVKTAIATGLLAIAASSHASLILVGAAPAGGSGLGTVPTVLTVSSPGSTSTETGGVSYNGTKDVFSGDAKTGASQSQTLSLTDAAASASQLRVIFNAVEPGNTAGGDNGITLTNLILTIYSSAGAELFNSGAFATQTFNATFNGTGNSGYLFKLDDAQAAAAQAAGYGTGAATNRIGLFATATNATGGFETFYLTSAARLGGGGSTSIPEPASLALMGLGLAGLGTLRRRRSV